MPIDPDRPPRDPISVAYPNQPDSYGVSKRPDKGYQIKDRPRVNEHVARMLVKYNMDMKVAVSKMLPPDATENDIARQADILEKRPRVREAIINLLHTFGLDDDAQKILIAKMWEVALNPGHKQWPTVIKAFGDLFGWSKKADESNKPQSLPIRDFDKGVKNMFGDTALPDISSVSDKIELPDDDGEERVQ